MNSRYRKARIALLFWTLFIGIGAVGGALTMFIEPSGKNTGMDGLLPYLQLLPFADKLFQNLIFSGVALFIVNGITNLVAATLLFLKKKSGIICGTVFGFTLMLWIIIQFVIMPANFMSTIYFFFGLFQLVAGIACYIGYEESQFRFDCDDYGNIGKSGKNLVVFFSREGYAKKVAYELADRIGADIYEIKAKERTEGNLGFWWCGRFGMHGWAMPTEDCPLDLSSYDTVTICFPIWVFSAAATVKDFCKKSYGKIKFVNLISLHFMNAYFVNAADEIDGLLGVKRNEYISLRCRFGKVKETKSK